MTLIRGAFLKDERTWQNAFSIGNCFVIASNNDVISRSEGEGGGRIGPKNCGYPYSMPPKQNDD